MSDLLHDITKSAGRRKRAHRIGRGEGSKGKTGGRGQKGAGSRAGKNKRIGFEGGQTEVYRRFPQRGFSNKPFETRYHVVNLSALERFDDGSTVDQRALKQAGLISNVHLGVKILGGGKLTRRLTVIAADYSRSAHKAIIDAGGDAQDGAGQAFVFDEPRTRRQSAKLDKRLERLGLPAREKAAEEAPKSAEKSGKAKTQKKQRSPEPAGESGDVTTAPESGTRESGGMPRGKSKKSGTDTPTEAPESGEKE
jgi:large subunit ribosomal protein L15